MFEAVTPCISVSTLVSGFISTGKRAEDTLFGKGVNWLLGSLKSNSTASVARNLILVVFPPSLPTLWLPAVW